MKEQVMVYQFEMEMMEQYTFGEEIPAGIYEGFFIKAEQGTDLYCTSDRLMEEKAFGI